MFISHSLFPRAQIRRTEVGDFFPRTTRGDDRCRYRMKSQFRFEIAVRGVLAVAVGRSREVGKGMEKAQVCGRGACLFDDFRPGGVPVQVRSV